VDRTSQLIASRPARSLDKAQISPDKPIEWVKESGDQTIGLACVLTVMCLGAVQFESPRNTILRFIVAFRSSCGRVGQTGHGHFLPKVKVKCTLVQALRLCTCRTAHRGSRGMALPFHDHGTRRE